MSSASSTNLRGGIFGHDGSSGTLNLCQNFVYNIYYEL